jgi:hypothetical protein
MSATILLAAAIVVRAEEAWEPVLFGGMIPIIGAVAVLWIIIRAVRDNPENDEDPAVGERDNQDLDP